MSLDKIGLTLYDFLGYLLPGYVWVFVFSVVESTFGSTSFLSLSTLGENMLLVTLASYFLGHASHAIGSVLKQWRRKWFSSSENRLSSSLYDQVQKGAQAAYGIKLSQPDKLGTLETYLLADCYVVASGGSRERDILLVREGFYKAGMVAFALLLLVSLVSIFAGGMTIQTQPRVFAELSIGTTVALTFFVIFLTFIFRRRFAFFGRVKVNNTLLIFLALYRKDMLETKE